MNEHTMYAIIMIAFFFGIAFTNYSNNETKKACYEAMKTNQSLKCDR